MKPTTPLTLRSVTSLAALFSIAPTMAAEPAKKEEATGKDKKKGDGEVLDEINIQASRENAYKTEALTSKKYTVPLRDVPQTITVIPRKIIEEQGATTLTEVLRNIPGITMTGGENGNAGSVAGDAIMMRGFDATNSIFVDGVRDNGVISRDSFNTESVEVFQGPTGSDVGRGNAAGYINQATKTPHLGNAYAGSASYASGDRQRYTLDLNQEVPNLNGTALRLNGVFQDGGFAGRDFAERNLWGIAPSVAFGLGTDTRAIFTYQHIEQRNLPDYGLPAYRNHLAPGVDDEWFYGTFSDYDDSDQDTLTFRIEHDFSENLKLSNQTRYNHLTRTTVATRSAYSQSGATSGQVTRAFFSDDRKNQIFSNLTNLTAKFETGSLRHAVSTGIELTREDQDTYGLVGAGSFDPIAPGTEPSHGVPGNFADFTRGPGYSYGTTETIGLYAFDTVEITPQWSVTGGMRMDHYNTEYESYAIPRGGSSYQYSGPFHEGGEVYSGKIGVVYKPAENGSIYAAYSRTATPPGTGNFSLSDSETSVSGINTDPQISENWELGTKWDLFESRLSLTGAIFYTENTNFIYQDDPLDTASYSSDGGQQIFGVSVGAVGQITENWSVMANVTYLDAEIDQPGNVIDGNRLSRTPNWAASVWTTYTLPKGFTVGLGFRCQDSVNTSTIDDAPTMPGFGVLDGFVQYDVNENLNFRLNAYNLLDNNYIASTSGGGGGDTGGTGGTTGGGTDASGNRIMMGAPLSFALSANYKF